MGGIVSQYVFVPPRCSYTTSHPHQVTWLQTASHKQIPAYYLKSKDANMKTHILYSHGNAADIGQMHDFLQLLRNYLNVNVFHYEYVGYGLASDQGSPSEKDTYESVEAAYDYLTNTLQVSPSDIIVFGTSVGSGPSCHIASKHRGLKGLILECPFSSIMRVVTTTMFARPIDMFQNINKIDQVQFPVFIIHGRNDDVVPFEHGEALYEKVPDAFKYPPEWIDNATHHNIIEKLTVRGYIKKLMKFNEHCTAFVKERDESGSSPRLDHRGGRGSSSSSSGGGMFTSLSSNT